jgi:AcrR family transcriptional regulator
MPGGGSRPEQRRRTEARILDAAARLFLAAGYERTTIRAVASAAGVDAGLVMHYFGSKQELLRAAIISAIFLGVTVSRHLIESDELATADPAHVIGLLRPCMISLAAQAP